MLIVMSVCGKNVFDSNFWYTTFMSNSNKPTIGFIGQGWIGKNYADDFENRKYTVIRYALEAPYNQNKDKIKDCDIVFIAVPTPTTTQGFDDSILRKVLGLVGKGKIAVIKSTLLVGRTAILQKENPDIIVLHSPEFLVESTAAEDAAHPSRNIVGVSETTKGHREAAEKVLSVLPESPYSLICTSQEAEIIKYTHNVHGYIQVIFSNIMYDVAQAHGANWEVLKESFKADPMMSHYYLNPIHKSGRGAGGDCFIKDFEAFIEIYRSAIYDENGQRILEAIRDKNLELLLASNKDLKLLEEVYGKAVLGRLKK